MGAKTVRVVIEDAWRLKGRRPPAKLTPYFSLSEWNSLTNEIYLAILPAIGLKSAVVYLLTGLFAMPLLSFVILVGLVLFGVVDISAFREGVEEAYEYYDDAYDHEVAGVQIEQEDAFQLLLLITGLGCVAMAFLVLMFGSTLRYCYYQGVVADNLASVVALFHDSRRDYKDSVSIELQIRQPERNAGCCRQAFFKWCDLEYDFKVSIRDNGDDYVRM